MASSFYSQIPEIINILVNINPKSVLDIGKGFGKYGFLIHEYVGIDNQASVDPNKTLSDLSRVSIDAIEVDETLLLPHLNHIYRNIFIGDVFDIYKRLEKFYDVVLMIDVIEHLDKEKAKILLQTLIEKGSTIVLATPIDFFDQHLYDSVYEEHVSHWNKGDFKKISYVQSQQKDGCGIYILSSKPLVIKGFGDNYIQKLKRIFKAIKSEI